MKVKINKIFINDKNKEGVAYTIKKGKNAGKPFSMASLYATDKNGQEQKMTCCLFEMDSPVFSWKVGDEVEIVIERNGEFLNFKIPGKLDLLEDRVKRLEDAVFSK